jgi:3-dehydroshikimate dehydratase
MRPGLVSITFRKLTPGEIVERAADAGLACIEWGGDVHVPHGEVSLARDVAKLTVDRGMAVSAYGSYLRLAHPESPSDDAVVETALALGAPTIRVWAGKQGSAEADDTGRRVVADAAIRLADAAAAAGLTISYEFHGGTLTDSPESAARLLREAAHPAIRSFWQPPVGMDDAACLASIDSVLPVLTNVHAFHWWPDSKSRHPLAEGRDRWLQFLRKICAAGKAPDVLLEFLPGDDPALLPREASSLVEILQAVEAQS